jgi:hypothetical protein
VYCRRELPLSSIDDDDDKNYASSLLSSLFFIVLGLKNQNQAQAPSPCIYRGDIGRRNHGYHQTVPMAAMVLPTRMCIIMVKKVAAGCGSSESKLYVGCIVLFVLEPTWELIRDFKKRSGLDRYTLSPVKVTLNRKIGKTQEATLQYNWISFR